MDDIELETAQIGLEAESFLSSHLGRYMIERAQMQEEDALEELVDVNPNDAKKNTEVRNKIYIARSIVLWINEAIQSGQTVIDQSRNEPTD